MKKNNKKGNIKMGKNENNKKCFVMMPFSTPPGYEEGHFQKIYDHIIMPSVKSAGFEPVRVDKNILSTDIVTKIFQGLTECDMAICDLSSRNPNVLYELGIRQAYNKPVLLIKDEKTEHIFDVGGLTTLPYNSNRLYENVIDAVDRISKALKEHDDNSENVINIIKGRLGGNFQASEIPTYESMDSDDRILNLLKSLIDDVDSIKQQINLRNVDSENDKNSNISLDQRKKLIDMLDFLFALKSTAVTKRTNKAVNSLIDEINIYLEEDYFTIASFNNLEKKYENVRDRALSEISMKLV